MSGTFEQKMSISSKENRQLDLRVGPLLRTTLLQLAEEEHILLLVTHHIVADGWSLDVLMGELTQLYKAHLYGQLSPLAEGVVAGGGVSRTSGILETTISGCSSCLATAH